MESRRVYQGHIRPWFGITDERRGRRERLPDGVYYLRVDGVYQRISNDPGVAVAHLKRELTKYSG